MSAPVAGVEVGHWTDHAARTGCTVVLFPEGTVASGEVRGGAPATRELALLAPGRLVDRIDALVLTGGSAFGLAAADGVMAWCEEQGRGFATPGGPVPIVVGLGLFDLAVGDPSVRPGPQEGLAACRAATGAGDGGSALDQPGAGAGAGCTTGKWRPDAAPVGGGLGSAVRRRDDLVVWSLVAVNALGDIDVDGTASTRSGDGTTGDGGPSTPAVPSTPAMPFGNTTIGLVATNARLDKAGCHLVAQSGHDGLARSLFPAHTRADGDALVAAATGTVDASVDEVRMLATAAVEAAVRSVAR